VSEVNSQKKPGKNPFSSLWLNILRKTIKSYLLDRIPDYLVSYIPTSFDILGSKGESVAIIEIPEELDEYRSNIAEAIHNVHGNVKSVLLKKSERHGEYRLRDFELLSGDPNTEVIHKESGCRFKIDPCVTYFSTRESTERERIVNQITKPEDVLVMFSGIGPFPICIAKKRPSSTVTAIELNPHAHEYCVENIRLNKVEGRVQAIEGDVRNVCPRLEKQYDRVLTPLPKGAHLYLDVIVPMVKPGGILHFYHWAPEDDLYTEAFNLVEEVSIKYKRKAEFLDGVKVSKYSPRNSKVRIDVRIN
jgi:tRNA (guanine37-N1)-methyltransferase